MRHALEDSIVVAANAVVLATRPIDGDVDIIHQLLETHDVLAGDIYAVGREHDFLEPAPRVFQDFPEPLVEHWLAPREDDAAHARQLVDHGEHFFVFPHLDAGRFRAVDAFEVASARELKGKTERQIHRIDQLIDILVSAMDEVLIAVVKDQAG